MGKYDELCLRLNKRHDALYGKGAVPSVMVDACAAIKELEKDSMRYKWILSKLFIEKNSGAYALAIASPWSGVEFASVEEFIDSSIKMKDEFIEPTDS